MLASCPNAMNYIDDVIIFAQTEEHHDKVVKEVLKIFSENNVLLNDDKCIWKTHKLAFLGHILSSEGIEVDPEKVETIMGFSELATIAEALYIIDPLVKTLLHIRKLAALDNIAEDIAEVCVARLRYGIS